MSIIDLMLKKVEEAKDMWHRKNLQVEGSCPAGFTEIALPIIIHEHLVGVAMSGQVFFDRNDILCIDKFLDQVKLHSKKNPHILEEHKNALETKRHLLFNQEKCFKSGSADINGIEKKDRRFYLTRPEWTERVNKLDEIVQSLEKVAEARYRDIRSRSENAFRDELMGYTQHIVMKQMNGEIRSFFDEDSPHFLHILQRMRSFWAFDAAAFLWLEHNSKQVNIVGYSIKIKDEATDKNEDQSKIYGFHGNPIQKILYEEFQEHPIIWLWDPKHINKQKLPANKLLNQIFFLIRDSSEIADLNLPRNECYLIVIVPFGENVYGFVFLDRDEKNVSRTPPKKSLAVSELCQEFILRTCTEMVYELCDVRDREQRKRHIDDNANKLKTPIIGIDTKKDQLTESDRSITGMAGMENA